MGGGVEGVSAFVRACFLAVDVSSSLLSLVCRVASRRVSAVPQARLAPLHKDAQADQDTQYPTLRPLLAEVGAQWAAAAGRVAAQAAAAAAAAGAAGVGGAGGGAGRFLPTDEPSFREWLGWQDFVLGA